MARERLQVTDLPPEILQEIFSYLSIRNFTNFTSCTLALFPFRNDPTYWSAQVQRTYQLPYHLNDLKCDSWRTLYQKLLTQTQLYTWGSNETGQLGHVTAIPGYEQTVSPYPNLVGSAIPQQSWVQIYLGIIVDVQCGAGFTILHNADGNLFIIGKIVDRNPTAKHGHHIRCLTYPSNWYMSGNVTYWPDTAIKQFSAGRSFVLGLSDTGLVWQWEDQQAVLLHFPAVEVSKRRILAVEAGYNRGAILVKGEGIMYWNADSDSDLVPGHQQERLSPKNRKTITTTTIPGTGFHPDLSHLFGDDSRDVQMGQIKHFVVMNRFILFATVKNKIYSYHAVTQSDSSSYPAPTELVSLYPPSNDKTPFEVRSIAGSARDAAMINTVSHGVLYLTKQFLQSQHNIAPDSAPHLLAPIRPPTLQHNDVVSLTMGDQHIHAVHTNGTITSLGIAANACGALGFPPHTVAPSPPWSAYRCNVDVKPLESTSRRTIRFEPMINHWLWYVADNSTKRFEGFEAEIAGWSEEEQDQYSENIDEWLEIESSKCVDGIRGRPEGSIPAWRYHDASPTPPNTYHAWQHPPPSYNEETYNHHPRKKQQPPTAADDALPPYFALKVAAGGSHSAALVLVDQFKAERVREVYRVPRKQHQSSSQGVWGWGKKFLGLKQEEEEGDHWVWEGEALPSRVLKRPVIQ